MSIIDALKKLVAAIGLANDPAEVPGDNIAEVIEQVAENVGNVPTSSSIFVVNMISDPQTGSSVLDSTWKEIYDAYTNGIVLLKVGEDDSEIMMSVLSMAYGNGSYAVYFYDIAVSGNLAMFVTDSEDGYPDSRLPGPDPQPDPTSNPT